MQWARAPLEELQPTGFFKLFPSEPQIEILTEAIGTFESRFRLPEFAEAMRLAEPIQASIAASLAQYAVRLPDLQIAVASMQSSWLDVLKGERSIKAFAELQGIGEAVRSLPPFDENLAGMLRANLEDFRERITWRTEVLTDLQVRDEFGQRGVGFHFKQHSAFKPGQGAELEGKLYREAPLVQIVRKL